MYTHAPKRPTYTHKRLLTLNSALGARWRRGFSPAATVRHQGKSQPGNNFYLGGIDKQLNWVDKRLNRMLIKVEKQLNLPWWRAAAAGIKPLRRRAPMLQKYESPDRVCVCVFRSYFSLDWGRRLHLDDRGHLRSHLLRYRPTVRTRSSRPPILRSHRRRCIKFVFSHCQHF